MTEVKYCNNRLLRGRDLPRLIIPPRIPIPYFPQQPDNGNIRPLEHPPPLIIRGDRPRPPPDNNRNLQVEQE